MIVAALLLPVMIGLAALAVEGGVWYADRHDLRSMADSAAVAAAWARTEGGDEDAAATDAAAKLGLDGSMDSVQVVSPPDSGAYAGDPDAIEVIVTRVRPLMLSTMFLDSSDITISVRAVSRVQGGGPVGGDSCLLALDPSSQSAINITGSADINLTDCGVIANSNHSKAITITGSGSITANSIQTPGDYKITGSGYLDAEEILTGDDVAPAADPFAGLNPVTPPGCDYTNLSFVGSGAATPPAPGSTLCGGFSITGSGSLALDPGIYYIKGGKLNLTGSMSLTGTGVTFVLSEGASVSITGSSYLDISAPTSGETKGVVFFSRETATPSKFTGSSDMNIQGALYFAGSAVDFTGSSDVESGCTHIVAYRVKFTGSTDLGNNCQGFGLSGGGGGGGAGAPSLVE